MARVIEASRRSILFSFRTLIPHHHHHHHHHHQSQHLKLFSFQPNKPFYSFLPQFCWTHTSAALQKSPFEENILRILRTEIEYQLEFTPLQQPVTKFNAFIVEDRPGKQWVTLRGKYTEDENIKIEATMFDGSAIVPQSGYDSAGEDVRLHISLLVDITRGEGCDTLEFVCSAWPDCLEIQKVYIFNREGSLPRPYMGSNFKDLDSKLREALYEFLKARGVNNDLSSFMHEYMINKDRTELICWLGKIRSFVEI